ncbi:hypothetical protein IQ249_24420 [Lusitaniella coriacea LEGE 07157]|uniref:Uncharacterized protein n=1 Tax=Lusitaniella coriacea LEGE 07157 TaxID=945747 RepID=A0A8J7E678_9CYAN|nr:hypothetical protein [Lusitaniella coriacea]MBE9119039.1 hypothetical protein [Lusitaniella coriacea LEGE 07157]
MRKVCYNAIFPDDSRETINNCELVDFLFELPILLNFGCIPPSRVINSLLLKGELNSGMGGSLEWEVFQLEEDEYVTLVDSLLKQPNLDIFTDKDFQNIEDLDKWVISIFLKYYKGNNEMLKVAEDYYQEKFGHS